MSTQLSKLTLTAGIVLALALTISCSDDKDDGGEQSYSYCITSAGCLPGPFTASTCTGQLSNACPNASSPSFGSSSSVGNFVVSSSSGSNLGGSSSSRGNIVSSSSGSNLSGSSSSNGGGGGGVVSGPTVNYGSETYQTVVIGSQTWMASNLNYEPSGTGVATNSKCYNDEPSNCTTYGRLYDWATAMKLPPSCNTGTCASSVAEKHQGICPDGWHIPSDADWDVLMTAVGGSGTAGKYLKATRGWNGNGNGEDKFGFSALPGGIGSGGGFGEVGRYGFWWSASELYGGAFGRYVYYGNENVYYDYNVKSDLFSIRCLQD